MTGAAPTKEQIAQLERVHKNHLALLTQAGLFRIALARKFGIKSPQFQNYNKLYVPSAKKFVQRQIKLEVYGKIPPVIPTQYPLNSPKHFETLINSFFNTPGLENLARVVKSYDQGGKGIGIIPLIIWAVIALAGMYTATSIVDDTNTSTSEMKELVDSTADFCAKNNLTPEQCKAILTQQTEVIEDQGGGFFSSLITPLLFLGGTALVVMNWDKIFKPKKAA